MKNTELYGYDDFSVDYDSTDVDDISDFHKYLTKNHDIKCLDLSKNVYWIIKRLHNRKFW